VTLGGGAMRERISDTGAAAKGFVAERVINAWMPSLGALAAREYEHINDSTE
jgi:hypothetical protein